MPHSYAMDVLRPDQLEATQQQLQEGRNKLSMFPMERQMAQQKLQQGQQSLDQGDIETAAKKLDYSIQSLGQVNDQAGYDNWRNQMHQIGFDTTGDPDQFDPNWKQQTLMQAIPLKERLALQIQQQNSVNQSGGWGANITPVMGGIGNGSAQTSVAPNTDSGNLSGEDFLKTIPEGVRNQVRAMANGDQPFPNPYAIARNPGLAKTVDAIYKYDPTANANRFGVMQDFSRGKSAQQVKSFSVLADHLGTLGDLADALDNGDVKALNNLNQNFSNQFGSSVPTNFNAAKQIVAQEIVKAVTGAAGALGDREEAEKQISQASSPKQLKGVIETYEKLAGGQLNGLKQMYETGTGRKDFMQRLSPQARKLFGSENTPQAGDVLNWSDF